MFLRLILSIRAVSLHPGCCSLQRRCNHFNPNPFVWSSYPDQLQQQTSSASHILPVAGRVFCFLFFLTIRLHFALHATRISSNQPFATVGRLCLSPGWAWSRGLDLAGCRASVVCSVWIIVKHITTEPNVGPAAPLPSIDRKGREKTTGLHNSCFHL